MRRQFKGRALLADDPGLGKTIQAILASIPFRRKRPIIVVCPSGIKEQWEREWKKWTGLDCWVLEGQKPPKFKPLRVPPVIIVNWEILQYWWVYLKRLKPSVVIADEVHYAKNSGTYRSKALLYLCRCKWIVAIFGLSGTPFENCPAELFPILHILRPDKFPKFKPFGQRFCDPKYTHWGIKYEGATRKKELRKLLKSTCMVRRRFESVIKDLPPVQRTVVRVQINRKKYEEAEKNIVKWLIKNRPEKAYKAQFVNHLAKMNYLLQYTAELKIKEIEKWIDNFLETSDQKVCVFGYNRAFLEHFHNKYKDISVLRYGGMSKKAKESAFHKFTKTKKCRLLFGSIPHAGTGLDGLQKVCWYMAVVQLMWNPMKLVQLEKRLHRILQKHPVSVTYVVADKTVEDYMCTSVIRKQKNFNSIIDGKKGKVELNILKTVMKKMASSRRRK